MLARLTICYLSILTICNFSITHFGFGGWMWVQIASVPDHCLFVTFIAKTQGLGAISMIVISLCDSEWFLYMHRQGLIGPSN